MLDIALIIAEELKIKKAQVEATVKLIDEGNTIPFISRYRKEATGALNDEVLRALDERLKYLRSLQERKAQVLSSIEEQGALTDELKKSIEDAMTLVVVEDLYRPYKPKRKTRASVARAQGLEPLAEILLAQETSRALAEEAKPFVDEEKGVADVAAAVQGAKDIIAESVSDVAEYRAYIREETFAQGMISSSTKDDTVKGVFENYYHYEEALTKVPGHRVLALNRGEKEKVLSVKITAPAEQILQYLETKVVTKNNPVTTPVLKDAVKDAYERLIAPAIEREIRNELTEKAEDVSIAVFKKNLSQLLLQPPIAGKTVLGWDPAFRTGCKLAVVDATGKVLDTTVVYPTAPQNKIAETKKEVKALIDRYGVELFSVGNGTASRESEQVIVDMIKEWQPSLKHPLQYVIVNEAGASVYSASKLASEEFPQFDVGQRSAASIARRLQDPLAELVKIDPKSIGVGQYQHDMNQKKLSEALNGVVEDCVNAVGVDLNTASVPLLTYISGINKTIAKNIVDYREANGAFKNREALLQVPKLGKKAFEQCAGFLRILDGDEVLDATSVHPESYAAARALMEKLKLTADDVKRMQHEAAKKKGGKTKDLLAGLGNAAAVAAELNVGEITLRDIASELVKPSRDPRDEMPSPVLRSDIIEMKDLTEGMVLKGTVRNLVDFGAFVDIGVHQDGLVHVSEITKRYIKHPMDALSVGDVVDVKVLNVDKEKNRISLTMKDV
ncbi:MAG: RNA-binding transcriptional accessory protein [Lachnospiraceae bacterium]|nr:RNA-binding transcriptional accessory protein [Lachnospiraceae bacterium]